jgi:hypothetical protein
VGSNTIRTYARAMANSLEVATIRPPRRANLTGRVIEAELALGRNLANIDQNLVDTRGLTLA